jgi:mono/diheme cytochrome c family protein
MKQVLLAIAALGLLVSIGWAQEEGAKIYKSKCASCHGADGGGKTAANLKMTKLSEDDMVLLLSRGDNFHKMPHDEAMRGMKDHEINAVVQYVKSLSPK